MKQIIALGGGGFSMEPEIPLLDQYILKQSNLVNPKVCFIPTASGDAEGYIQRFYQAFEKLDCVPSHLSLSRPQTLDLEDYIMDKDILYVGGGNTQHLLTLWKDWKLDQYIRTAWDRGIVLAGISAGSICWFEEGVTDSLGTELTSLRALGFLQGSNCPHYDGESDRRPSYHQLIESNQIGNGYATDDGVALHYRGDELFQVVSSRPGAMAYRVELVNHQAVETPIKPIYLGKVE
ncbi:peptidase E [Paenibacillus albiflavus]|uniref:Peptidase E n=1 Tax=Paenibacillus albiflavus TaxID=2545760 RepID=A0A4R4EK90_9BACL|nr:Type 1 glutamine amidotransferase-like domain-containing protein [Paenibacillus albiflavus]TCZ68315.1 peptidase E [Paenibacillus albiflavus]TCZ79863.1 peptidase E [Paenibacillus albiflavus]